MPAWVWRTIALLTLFGFSAWAIRRAGDRLRAELGGSGGKPRAGLLKDEIDAIVSSGLATPTTLAAMSPKEQRMLASMALALRSGQNQRPTREQ